MRLQSYSQTQRRNGMISRSRLLITMYLADLGKKDPCPVRTLKTVTSGLLRVTVTRTPVWFVRTGTCNW